ncbi:hypothetical protein [Deinococcus marmoris]|uniref:hypothetical protein n=1 Tax=Deinococcus marmoris TaxID=249408 RepID=UPI000A71D4EF|nr:hypothetical protein [Deinococcus marmoris]
MTDDSLTLIEADALMEMLEDKVTEFVARPYSDELREAIRKVRAVADLHPPPG